MSSKLNKQVSLAIKITVVLFAIGLILRFMGVA